MNLRGLAAAAVLYAATTGIVCSRIVSRGIVSRGIARLGIVVVIASLGIVFVGTMEPCGGPPGIGIA